MASAAAEGGGEELSRHLSVIQLNHLHHQEHHYYNTITHINDNNIIINKNSKSNFHYQNPFISPYAPPPFTSQVCSLYSYLIYIYIDRCLCVLLVSLYVYMLSIYLYMYVPACVPLLPFLYVCCMLPVTTHICSFSVFIFCFNLFYFSIVI